MAQHLQLRQQASMTKWSRLISEQKNSGLTIRVFCRHHDLSWHAYYYWLRKIREHIVSELPTVTDEPKPVFAELPVHDNLLAPVPDLPKAGIEGTVTIQLNGVSISLPAASSKATIINFLTAVKEMS